MDKIKLLLDAGWTIRFYRNALGTFTVEADYVGAEYRAGGGDQRKITDDFTIPAVIDRIYDKIYGLGEYV